MSKETLQAVVQEVLGIDIPGFGVMMIGVQLALCDPDFWQSQVSQEDDEQGDWMQGTADQLAATVREAYAFVEDTLENKS
jgi:hypothetical protein